MKRMKFSEKGLKALISLRTNTDFQTVLTDMSSVLDKSMQQILYGPDDKVSQERGYARCITEFFEAHQNAAEDLKKFDKPT